MDKDSAKCCKCKMANGSILCIGLHVLPLSLQVFSVFFSPFSKNKKNSKTGSAKLPQGVNECVKVCAWCPEMYYCLM